MRHTDEEIEKLLDDMESTEPTPRNLMPIKFHVVFDGVRRFKGWSRIPQDRAGEIYRRVAELASARDCDFHGDCPDSHKSTHFCFELGVRAGKRSAMIAALKALKPPILSFDDVDAI